MGVENFSIKRKRFRRRQFSRSGHSESYSSITSKRYLSIHSFYSFLFSFLSWVVRLIGSSWHSSLPSLACYIGNENAKRFLCNDTKEADSSKHAQAQNLSLDNLEFIKIEKLAINRLNQKSSKKIQKFNVRQKYSAKLKIKQKNSTIQCQAKIFCKLNTFLTYFFCSFAFLKYFKGTVEIFACHFFFVSMFLFFCSFFLTLLVDNTLLVDILLVVFV